MKKDKLIAILTSIKGNPDILLWNGMVGDWMDIDSKFVESSLVKMTQEYYIKSCESEEMRDRKDWEYKLPAEEVGWLKKQHKKHQWECNDYITQEDIDSKRWKEKKVLMINAKERGVSTWDRIGGIDY